ncbi:hypothetical protein HK100_002894, partial [Physocladia obscura]
MPFIGHQKKFKIPKSVRVDIFLLLFVLASALAVMVGGLAGMNLYNVCTAQTQIEVLDNRWLRNMARTHGGTFVNE